jgi:hypothetical protein
MTNEPIIADIANITRMPNQDIFDITIVHDIRNVASDYVRDLFKTSKVEYKYSDFYGQQHTYHVEHTYEES